MFVATIVPLALAGPKLALIVYALSFWHYYLYWLAFAFGTVTLAVFKRDAIAMKTLSIAAFALVYLDAPLDFLSLAVIACGVALNVLAARTLGMDRTYYGREVAGLPPRQETRFPYSLIAHPMIVGNVAAFGGALLNARFREQWWPLAGLHVALNLGLLAMELAGPQRRRGVRIAGGLVMAALPLAAALASMPAFVPADALVLVATAACAGALYHFYTMPVSRRSEGSAQ